jgi:hypothetical protein
VAARRSPGRSRDLIREISLANRLWGGPRIHGALLKLAIVVAASTVAKYLAKRPRRPGQRWATFLRNHAAGIGAVDLFVVPARTTMRPERICRWGRMHRSAGQSSTWATSSLDRWSADCIIDTVESSFRQGQAVGSYMC